MGNFLKSLDNLLTGKPDNLKYAKELGYKSFNATKEFMPKSLGEFNNKKNNSLSEKKEVFGARLVRESFLDRFFDNLCPFFVFSQSVRTL